MTPCQGMRVDWVGVEVGGVGWGTGGAGGGETGGREREIERELLSIIVNDKLLV